MADIYAGTNKIQKIYDGNNRIDEVYSGSQLIWKDRNYNFNVQSPQVTEGFAAKFGNYSCYGNNKFLSISYGNVLSSIDGLNWNFENFPLTKLSDNARAVYFNNRWIIVDYNLYSINSTNSSTISNVSQAKDICIVGNVLYVATTTKLYRSYDGITFTAVGTSTTDSTNYMASGNGIFVKSTAGNIFYVSSNEGTSWSTIDARTVVGNTIYSLTFANGLFVCCGDKKCSTSTDGVTWTTKYTTANTYCYAAAYSPIDNIWVISCSTSIVHTTNWSTYTTITSAIGFKGAAYGNGKVVLTSAGASCGTFSLTNGYTTITTNLKYSHIVKLDYVNGQYIAVGHVGTLFTSTNFSTWTSGKIFSTIYDIGAPLVFDYVYFNGKHYFATLSFSNTTNDNVLYYSSDLITFKGALPLSSDYQAVRLYVDDARGRLFICIFSNLGDYRQLHYTTGIGDTITTSPVMNNGYCNGFANDGSKYYFLSPTNIVKILNATDLSVISENTRNISFKALDFCYGNGKFIAVAEDGKVYYSTDAINYTLVTILEFGNYDCARIIYENDTWFICGGGGKFAMSLDGINWTYKDIGLGLNNINSIAYKEDRILFGSNFNTMTLGSL